jgi:hypothetical protein
VVPFSAIKSFFDPSVQFGLQFEPSEGGMEASEKNLASAPALSAVVTSEPEPAATPEPAAEDEPTKPSEGAEVVRLDRFRKK